MANDLRNFKALPGGDAPADYAKTLVMPRAQPRPAASDPAATTLIQDLDVFARQFEKQQEEALKAEAEERERKEEAIRQWAAAEEKKRQAFERERQAQAGATQAGTRRSTALDLLKQKAASRSTVVAADLSKRAEAIARVDERLRAAFRYLAEFTTVLNEANPVSDGNQGVMFFGDCKGMVLGEGFADMRTRDLNGKSCADYVTFKYRVRFPAPQTLHVPVKDAERVQERLKALGIKFEYAAQKNDIGLLARAAFVLSGPFPCQAVLRADYDEPGYTLELVNVRHHGPAKLRLTVEELNDDVLDEFGTWILGADESFERFLKRRP
jgi:hypothetical protein